MHCSDLPQLEVTVLAEAESEPELGDEGFARPGLLTILAERRNHPARPRDPVLGDADEPVAALDDVGLLDRRSLDELQREPVVRGRVDRASAPVERIVVDGRDLVQVAQHSDEVPGSELVAWRRPHTALPERT